MINASYEKEFVFQDGNRVKNILELCDVVERLSNTDFQSFVNPHKNDFANWIELVLLDSQLSERLRHTISKEQTLMFLKERLRETMIEEHSMDTAAKHSYSVHKPSQASAHVSIQSHDHDHAAHSFTVHTPGMHPLTTHAFVDATDDVTDTGGSALHSTHQHSTYSHPAQHPAPELAQNPVHPHHPGIGDGSIWKIKRTGESTSRTGNAVRTGDTVDAAKNKWFSFFSKNVPENNIEKTAMAEDEKLKPEHELDEEQKKYSSENIFWMILYGLLILLIISLAVYKLVLS